MSPPRRRFAPALSLRVAAQLWIAVLWPALYCQALASELPCGSTSAREDAGSSPPNHNTGRTFFWKEVNFVGFFSPRRDRLDLSPRPQRTSVGFEYAGKFPEKAVLKTLFKDRLEGVSFDVHPLAIFDPIDRQVKFVFHDAWVKLGVKNHSKSSFKVGHFLIPFGQNPILEPRGFFFLPLTAPDLGFKRDWGVSFQSVVSDYVYEVALTAGSGLGIHHRDGNYMVAGRIGKPTFKDFQYGFSALYGQVPEIRAERILSDKAITRWRVAADMIYKYGTYTILKSEFVTGKDSDAPVLGYQAEVDYILPQFQNWELKVQLGSWFTDLRRNRSTDTWVIAGLSYSLSTSTTLSWNYIHDLQRLGGGMKDDRIFVQLHFYR